MRIPLAALAAFIALTAPASARDTSIYVGGPATSSRTSWWTLSARDYWNRAPGCGHTVRLFKHAPMSGNEPADAEYGRCRIYLTPLFFSADITDEQRCNIITHEYGHLIGRSHTTNPRSVMYSPPDRLLTDGTGWRIAGLIPDCAPF